MILVVGTIIRHHNPEGEWVAKVLEIDEEANELKVYITSTTSGQWHETWNLAHTRSGFEQGTYESIGTCDD